jgi:5'-methylthioadenosine phosphorylase
VLGVIGGSGVYQLEGLAHARWERVASPFGAPSDEILLGELAGQPMAFLPRHGRGHRTPPSGINYRANIDAMKRVGVTDLLSLSAVGSLREDLAPGTFVIVDQFVDRTTGRERTFFDRGVVAHVPLARPVCGRIGDALESSAQALGLPHRRGGTSLVIEGPQFSTLAESELYRQWGCDVIGMTSLPEARLAREAELCYATVAMVTDYDCWHPDHDSVTVPEVMAVMQANSSKAAALLRQVAPGLAVHPSPCPHGCDRVLDAAIVTTPEARDPETVRRLSAVAGRILGEK